MYILGVTGGIGAGKSSVSGILEDFGAVVIDADKISRSVTEPGKPAWNKIRERFGESIINPDQSIDRMKLASIVFHSDEERLKLEDIIHAEVITEMKARLEDLERSGFDGIAVLDVPIPVKHGFLDLVDRVWSVVCSDEIRIKRVMERSGISRYDAEKRIEAQLSQKEYMDLADDVIVNEGTPEDLRNKVAELYEKLKRQTDEK